MTVYISTIEFEIGVPVMNTVDPRGLSRSDADFVVQIVRLRSGLVAQAKHLRQFGEVSQVLNSCASSTVRSSTPSCSKVSSESRFWSLIFFIRSFRRSAGAPILHALRLPILGVVFLLSNPDRLFETLTPARYRRSRAPCWIPTKPNDECGTITMSNHPWRCARTAGGASTSQVPCRQPVPGARIEPIHVGGKLLDHVVPEPQSSACARPIRRRSMARAMAKNVLPGADVVRQHKQPRCAGSRLLGGAGITASRHLARQRRH